VPDLMALYQQGQLTSEAVHAVQLGLIAHCELMGDRIALLDSPPELSTAQVRDWRDSVGYESPAGALYYPWVQVHDPLANAPLGVPPSGHVAGVFARTAATRGVHCSPANEPLRGALGTAYPLMRAEIDLLNPRGINTIVAATASGVSVLGGRTLSSDPAWAPVRRRTLANFIHTSMERGMRWVIHETVDAALWEQVTVELERFCDLLLQAGALSGSSPEEAYQVRCDASTNSAEDRDRTVTAHVFLIVAGGLPLNLRIVFATF
jgi:phage tail sheath protein FI